MLVKTSDLLNSSEFANPAVFGIHETDAMSLLGASAPEYISINKNPANLPTFFSKSVSEMSLEEIKGLGLKFSQIVEARKENRRFYVPSSTQPAVPALATAPTQPAVPAPATAPTQPAVPAPATAPTQPAVPAPATAPTQPVVPAPATNVPYTKVVSFDIATFIISVPASKAKKFENYLRKCYM